MDNEPWWCKSFEPNNVTLGPWWTDFKRDFIKVIPHHKIVVSEKAIEYLIRKTNRYLSCRDSLKSL